MRTTALLWLLLLTPTLVNGEGLAVRPAGTTISRWTTIDGIRIHYRESGYQGNERTPPLLLVHGWMGSSYDFTPLMDHLPASLRAIAVDLPGSGLSQKSGIDFSVDYYVQFLDSFISFLGAERVVLVGHSMGGGLAVNFAVRHPNRVARLILIDPDGLKGEEGVLGLIRRMDFIVELGTQLNNRLAIEMVTKLTVFDDPALVTREFIDSIAATSLTPDGRRAQAQITRHVLGNDPVDNLLPLLSVPTLVLWGEQDRVLPPKWGSEFARRIAGAKLVMIPNSGHMPQFEAPGLVARQIEEFLSQWTN